MINIYTDGSYHRSSGRCGYGYVILDEHDNIIHEAKGEVKDLFFTKHWNVGGEVAAVLEALKVCVTEGFKEVTIYHDYNGIGYWGSGKWRANTPLTKYYKDWVNQLTSIQNMKINWQWIKGHSGKKWNEYVDKLAQEAIK